MHPLRKMLLS